jgi:hypothetical protein
MSGPVVTLLTPDLLVKKIAGLARALPKRERAGFISDFAAGNFDTARFTLEFALSDCSGITIKDLRLMVALAWIAYAKDSRFMAGFISECLVLKKVPGANDCLRAAVHRGYTKLLEDVSSRHARSKVIKARTKRYLKSEKDNPFSRARLASQLKESRKDNRFSQAQAGLASQLKKVVKNIVKGLVVPLPDEPSSKKIPRRSVKSRKPKA